MIERSTKAIFVGAAFVLFCGCAYDPHLGTGDAYTAALHACRMWAWDQRHTATWGQMLVAEGAGPLGAAVFNDETNPMTEAGQEALIRQCLWRKGY